MQIRRATGRDLHRDTSAVVQLGLASLDDHHAVWSTNALRPPPSTKKVSEPGWVCTGVVRRICFLSLFKAISNISDHHVNKEWPGALLIFIEFRLQEAADVAIDFTVLSKIRGVHVQRESSGNCGKA